MAWETPTVADIRDAISGPEYEAVQNTALAVGEDDPWPGLLESAIEMVRGYIVANVRNQLGAVGTVPTIAKRHLIKVVVWDGVTRFPDTEVLATNERREASDMALKFFEKLATTIAVEKPDSADVVETDVDNRTGGFERVDENQSSTRIARRKDLNGLF
jgi:hypothetical protein